jgi:hypothetical protein
MTKILALRPDDWNYTNAMVQKGWTVISAHMSGNLEIVTFQKK